MYYFLFICGKHNRYSWLLCVVFIQRPLENFASDMFFQGCRKLYFVLILKIFILASFTISIGSPKFLLELLPLLRIFHNVFPLLSAFSIMSALTLRLGNFSLGSWNFFLSDICCLCSSDRCSRYLFCSFRNAFLSCIASW